MSITGDWDRRISRQKFLGISGMSAAALVLGAQGVWLPRRGLAQTITDSNPFKPLGVASGDPLPNSVVLWTRLAPDPLNGGGMPDGEVTVDWEVASDSSFSDASRVRSGQYTAKPDLAHSVHVDAGVEGTGDTLQPATTYYYRFGVDKKSDGTYTHTSPTGRTKTAPDPNASSVSRMKFAFVSCQHWESGLYPTYGHIAAQPDLDLVIHLGDYIYEGAPSGGKVARKNSDGTYSYHSAVADPSFGCNTLADYRNRHAQYKTDQNLQAAHAAHPWAVTWDDHEVENDYAGTNSWYRPSDFAARRAAAYQAYYEHMPIRPSSVKWDAQGKVQDVDLKRQITYGNLVQFLLLDTRQYRSYWPCANQGELIEDSCKERLQDPILNGKKPVRRHSYLGANGSYTEPNPWLKDEQENWLKARLTSSNPKWNVLASQVIMFQYDHRDWTGNWYEEAWDGYAATRNRVLKHIADNKVPNPIVLSGDMHCSWAANLEANFNDRSHADVVGAEFTGTSISSGLSSGWEATYRKALTYNQHVKLYDGRTGGYVLCTIDENSWTSDYLLANSLSDPNSSMKKMAYATVAAGTAGIKEAKKLV